jgi:general secretion pathway protein E
MTWLPFFRKAAGTEQLSLTEDVTDIIGVSAISQPAKLVEDDRLSIPAGIKEYVVAVQRGNFLTLHVAEGWEQKTAFKSLQRQLERSKFWTLQPIQLMPGDQIEAFRESFRVSHPAAPTRAQLDMAEMLKRWAIAGVSDVQLRQHQNFGGFRLSIDGEYTGNRAVLSKKEIRDWNHTLFGMADQGSIDGHYTDRCSGGAAIVENLAKFGIAEHCTAVRLQFAAAAHGPECSIRIQSAQQVARPMDQLGLSAADLQLLRDMADFEGGAIFVSAPTGHGKTNFLASWINDCCARHPGERVMTIEDPVEIHLADEVSQLQMTAQDAETRGPALAKLIRQALRQHPQRLMLGECRDFESTDMLLQGGLTGVVGLSTVHATTASGIIPRLRAWKIDDYILTNTGAITGLIALRLPKTLCQHCRIRVRDATSGSSPRTDEIVRAYEALSQYAAASFALRGAPVPALAGAFVRNPDGCDVCRVGKREGKPSYGDAGRALITEIINPDEKFLQLMCAGHFEQGERYLRAELAVPSLREDAISRVARGEICVLDAYKATGKLSAARLHSLKSGAQLKAAS